MTKTKTKITSNYIDLWDGEKGGVGKSMGCKTYIQYLLDRNIPFKLVETDRSNADVMRIYQDIKGEFAIFSESEQMKSAADLIFDLALSGTVVVNLPATVDEILAEWIEKNQLIQLGQSNNIAFRKWFLMDGEYDSTKHAIASLKRHGTDIEHILVKNFGKNNQWSHLDELEELQTLIKNGNVKTINFPKLETLKEKYIIDRQQLTFAQAREYKDFGIVSRQRVKNFLEAAYREFDFVLNSYQQNSQQKGDSLSSEVKSPLTPNTQ